jgi:hypothetical protein
VPALWRQPPIAAPDPRRRDSIWVAFIGFVFAALLLIVQGLTDHL